MSDNNSSELFSLDTERVKSVGFHPTEPLLAAALYSGKIMIIETNNWETIKIIEPSTDKPARCVRWIPNKKWIICAGDDSAISAYDYLTGQLVCVLEGAHSDFIRCLSVSPSNLTVLSCSDDTLVHSYAIENERLVKKRVFRGHDHYVMDVKFNPMDANTFATASLDQSIKFWDIQSAQIKFSLNGHSKGINCIEFCKYSSIPLIASAGDDFVIMIWNYQKKTCIASLYGHRAPINSIKFHEHSSSIVSTGEDEAVITWDSTNYTKKTEKDCGKQRGWTIDCKSRCVAIGFDSGLVALNID